jgi:hypothetical protein
MVIFPGFPQPATTTLSTIKLRLPTSVIRRRPKQSLIVFMTHISVHSKTIFGLIFHPLRQTLQGKNSRRRSGPARRKAKRRWKRRRMNPDVWKLY